MASSLFNNASRPSSNMVSRLNAVKGLIGGNPQAAYDNLMSSNPQFAEFVHANQGKTPEQIAAENNIDFQSILNALS